MASSRSAAVLLLAPECLLLSVQCIYSETSYRKAEFFNLGLVSALAAGVPAVPEISWYTMLWQLCHQGRSIWQHSHNLQVAQGHLHTLISLELSPPIPWSSIIPLNELLELHKSRLNSVPVNHRPEFPLT